MECHGDDTPLTFHDTPLSSYYCDMLPNLMYDTPIEIGLSLTYIHEDPMPLSTLQSCPRRATNAHQTTVTQQNPQCGTQ